MTISTSFDALSPKVLRTWAKQQRTPTVMASFPHNTLCQYITRLPFFQKAQSVLAFYPMPDELSLEGAWQERPQGQRWFFPKLVEKADVLSSPAMAFLEKPSQDPSFQVVQQLTVHPQFTTLQEPIETLERVAFEPLLQEERFLPTCLVCVPGLIFGVLPEATSQPSQYVRMGRGRGYYDRYLAWLQQRYRQCRERLLLVGVSPQVTVPEAHTTHYISLLAQQQPWDIPLEALVTERGYHGRTT
ncbi:MAG: 5-formyltetrahydrofolate cyclo-ligase [Vampirovibrionales bacterium]